MSELGSWEHATPETAAHQVPPSRGFSRHTKFVLPIFSSHRAKPPATCLSLKCNEGSTGRARVCQFSCAEPLRCWDSWASAISYHASVSIIALLQASWALPLVPKHCPMLLSTLHHPFPPGTQSSIICGGTRRVGGLLGVADKVNGNGITLLLLLLLLLLLSHFSHV